MNKTRVFYIKDMSRISRENYIYIDTCLGDLEDIDVNELSLIKTLNYLLEYQGFGTEMCFIMSGREIALEYLNPEDSSDKTYIDIFEEMGTEKIIIFKYNPYDPYEVIVPEKFGIKIITDWCAENTTNPEIPNLCKQLKQKYEVE